MKKVELSESGKKKMEEALRRYYEREARVEDSLKEYAINGIYNILKNYERVDSENPQDCIINEGGVFGELVYFRITKLNRETGKITKEFFIDVSNLVEGFIDEEKGL